MNPAKIVNGDPALAGPYPGASAPLDAAGSRSSRRPNLRTVVDGECAAYWAPAIPGAVIDNEDGTFSYTPPDETSMDPHSDVVEIITRGDDAAVEAEHPHVAGPFGTIDHPRLGVRHGEHVFFYRVPTDLAHLDSTEIHGATNGVVGGFGSFEVHADPQIDVFGDLDHGDRLGREFGLMPGSYIGFVYEPTDLEAAYAGPTTDTLSFTVGDGTGSIRHCVPFTITIPASSLPTEVRWSPRSRPNGPNGSIDLTRLDAFTGSTYLPTGEVVFEVSAREFDADDVTFTQPSHGTVTAFGPHRVTLTGGLLSDFGDEVIRLVYTPNACCRTDPTVHTDAFTFEADDGQGGRLVTTVPVSIAKAVRLHANDGPYLGNGSFSGRVEAPFDHVHGYVAVSSALLAESIGSMVDNPWSVGTTLFGTVVVDGDGRFTYTRDPDWADLPVGEIDDSFTVIAYTADNQWAAAVVPVGGRALTSYPSMTDLVGGLPIT